MGEKLNPCAECRGVCPEFVRSLNNGLYFVECPTCGHRTGALYQTKADAAELWNRRYRISKERAREI